MDIDSALDFISSQLMAKKLKTLSTLETIILKEAWRGKDRKSYDEIGNSEGFAGESVKTAAYKLWRRLSDLCAEKINRDNVQAVVERYYNKVGIASPSTPISSAPNFVDPNPVIAKDNLSTNLIAYDDTWVGRQDTITTLKQKISGSGRIIILNGITGIGKTALAEKLYTELTTEKTWNKLLRVNFDNQDQSDFGNFVTVVDRWLQKCDVLVTPEDRQDIPRLQKRLIEYIGENSCLIIIDSLEWILKGNQEYGWSEFKDRGWVDFLRLFLSQVECNSRIIITTQHLPEDVSAGYDNFWFCQKIKGLEVSEQLELFKKIGIEIQSKTEINYLERIGKVYEGHALALKTIAGTIKTVYQGNILAYWQEEGKEEIEKVEKDLELSQENMIDAWKLHNANSNLYFKVCYRFNKAFERLKKYNYYSYLLICITSTYLSPHSKEDLLEHLADEGCSEKEQKIALQTLIEEQLIETIFQKNTILFGLHNLIRSVAYEHFQNLD